MSALYGRKVSLLVGQAGGTALDLSKMHFQFWIRKAIVSTPSILQVRVWNLAQKTIKSITTSQNGLLEFNRVVLQAGYLTGPYGTIFTGDVRYYRTGRTSPTDTYLDIYAADGDKAFNYTLANGSVPAGGTQQDAADLLSNWYADNLISGVNVQIPTTGVVYPRGKVMFGRAPDYSRDIAENINSQWSIQDGTQQYLARTDALPLPPVVVNSATGMLGIPVQTIYGVEVRMLLNPTIKYGQLLKINNADIQTAQLDLSIQGAAQNAVNQLGSQFLDADGFYKVIAGEYEGDTRGQPWDLTVTCVTADTSTSRAAVQSGWLPGP